MNNKLVLLGCLLATGTASAQEVIELPGEDRWLEAEFEDLYRLGTMTGEDWEQFGDVHNVAFDGGGNLHVLDRQAKKVFVVSPDGRLIRELGGQGEGPGELSNAAAIAVMAQGRVVVADLSRRGYHLFGANGEFERMVRMSGAAGVTRVGMPRAQPGADAIIGVPTASTQAMFTGAAFSGPIVLPSSHVFVRTSLSGEEAETDTIFEAWLPPINFDDLSENQQRNYGALPTRLLPALSPDLYWGVLSDGRVAFSDSSAYEVKIAEAGRGVVRILKRPFLPEPMTGRMIRAERSRHLRRLEELVSPGPVLGRGSWRIPRAKPELDHDRRPRPMTMASVGRRRRYASLDSAVFRRSCTADLNIRIAA